MNKQEIYKKLENLCRDCSYSIRCEDCPQFYKYGKLYSLLQDEIQKEKEKVLQVEGDDRN